jgi:phosphoglycerol transferase MdoB-like AlkP superfamily enzyme
MILAMVGLSRLVGLRKFRSEGIRFYISHSLLMIVFFGLMVLGLRSGLPPKQHFPLSPSDAGQYVSNPNDIAIVQNTPFCMLRTWNKPVYQKHSYFPKNELESIYSPIHFPDTTIQQKRMNVVIILGESLGREAIGFYNKTLENGTYKGYTPFLDSLCDHSLVYLNSFANSRISVEATPSVVASIPSLQESYTLSFYADNKINSLASCLSGKGYETAFAHAAPNGSLGLNAFAVMAGISKYIGKSEYANDADFDGVWGIWDHKFLPFFARKCSEFKPPFLATLFTLSSHDPCKLPHEFFGIQDEKVPKILKSINYLDYSLKLFFQEASGQPWYDNTIFIITGDHTSTRYHESYKTSLGSFAVPIIFYTPGKQLPPGCDTSRVAQQIDIMPTILNYMGYDQPYFAFGKDLFNPATDNFAISYIGNSFQLVWDHWVIQFDGSKTNALYDRNSDPLLKNNLINKNPEIQNFMERKIKAIVQQYNNRMTENRLLPF